MKNELSLIKKSNINFDNFRIDVGSASIAPHASNWILYKENCSVLLIEPNSDNIKGLIKGDLDSPEYRHVYSMNIPNIKMEDKTILCRGSVIKKYQDNQAFLIKAAIDNVDLPKKVKFYCSDERNRGCSSLLAPGKGFGLTIEKTEEVDVVSLEYILDEIQFPEDKLIQFIKTDTQGKDFDVVKSLGKYLDRVVCLKCEYNVGDQYENSCSPIDFLDFMIKNSFELVHQTPHDYLFINRKYKNEKNIKEFENLPTI